MFDDHLRMKSYQSFPMEILKVVLDNEEITAAVEDEESSLMESKVRECWEGYWWMVILAWGMLKMVKHLLVSMTLLLAC